MVRTPLSSLYRTLRFLLIILRVPLLGFFTMP